MATNKVIVTNLDALRSKYAGGYGRVAAAVTKLIAADAKRGLKTQLIGLDDKKAMSVVGASPVTKADDPAQNKTAIDAVYRFYTPDYILILGAVDIVPHQNLANPVYSAADPVNGDPDPTVPSDLPYACAGAYATAISPFINPVRVVGRLPDITGGNDPGYLEKLIASAVKYASSPAANYQKFLGVTAAVWTASTKLSLQAAFGTTNGMNIVPPSSSNWPQASLNAPSHFVNCHGSPSMPQYFGQPTNGGNSYPVALDAAYLQRKKLAGTVVAAECCYGAELYNPTLTGKHQGIPNQYLENGAFGFWGSTTVAYGPANTNDWADLICQYFFQSLLKGASLGRAALEARQTYIYKKGQLTGTDLKTLAQFILLGDPSVTPVASITLITPTHFIMKNRSLVAADPVDAADMDRKERREELIQNGFALEASVGTSEKKSKTKPRPQILKLLKKEGKKLNLTNASHASFEVKSAPSIDTARVRLSPGRTGRTLRKGIIPATEVPPVRKLKAVHRTVGRVSEKNKYSVGIAGVEILEYEDGVTIHPFESR